MSCWRNTAVVFSFVGFSLLLAALTSEFWVQGQYHMGLWKFCQNGFRCVLLDMDVPGYIHATRAFLLTAEVAGAISFFSLCFLCCSSHSGSKTLVKTSAIASFIAGLCALLAMAIFTGVYSEQYQQRFRTWYDWSLGVGWGSVPLYLLAVYLDFTRCFMILGVIASIIAMLWSVDWDHVIHCNFIFVPKALITSIFSFLSGSFVLLAVVIFALKLDHKDVNPSKKWGFYLSIPVIFLCIMSGIYNLVTYKLALWGTGTSTTHVGPEILSHEDLPHILKDSRPSLL